MIVGRNVFIGQLNGKTKKKDCAVCKRTPAEVTLPLNNNGFIYTGRGGRVNKELVYEYPDGLSLIVIDIDIKTPITIEQINEKQDVSDTYVVKTGSGGYHLYYFVDYEFTNFAGLKPINELTDMVKAIDIRGYDGIIFGEGNKFIEHPSEYEAVYTEEPKIITKDEFLGILSKFTQESDKLLSKEQEEVDNNEVEEIPENNSPKKTKKSQIRLGFEMILDGRIELSEVKIMKGVNDEFQMWKLLYRELHNCGYNLDEARRQLAETQTEYDDTTTNQQLAAISKDKSWNKRPTKESYIQYFGDYLPDETPEETDDSIIYEIQNRSEYAIMEDDGIYHVKMKYTDNGFIQNRLKVFDFNEFTIESKYFKNGLWYYNFSLNNNKYYGRSLSEILKHLNMTCGLSSYKALSNVLIQKYIQKVEIEDKTKDFSEYCGYYEGWKLSQDVVEMPNMDSVQELRNKIFYRNTEFIDGQKEKFIELYNITDFDHKDIIIAFGLVSPFLYNLMDYFSIMPQLFLVGNKYAGKTAMAKLITTKFFGHIDHVFTTAISLPRLEAAISSSTFPICIDDIENMKAFLMDILKPMTTTKSYYKRQNPDGSTKHNIPHQSPIIGTCNYLPEIFEKDMAYNSRCIVLNIKNHGKKNPKWIKIYNELQDGFMLDLLIKFTENKTLEELLSVIDSDISENRNKSMIKIINFGKYLAKKILGLELDIDYSVFCDHNKVDDEIFDLIKFQCVESKKIGKCNDEGMEYRPTNWVKTNVYMFSDEYRYTSINLNDLPNKNKDNLKLKRLYDILLEKWKGITYSTQKIDGICMKCISIPKKYIEHDEQQIIIENIMEGTTEEL